jgi:hypothetical protein
LIHCEVEGGGYVQGRAIDEKNAIVCEGGAHFLLLECKGQLRAR